MQIPDTVSLVVFALFCMLKGAVSRNSAKLGNYKMPVKLTEDREI